MEAYQKVVLKQGQSYADVEMFLLDYEMARTKMIEAKMLSETDLLSVQRKFLDFRQKIFGAALL